jgi:mannosyltransferase
MKYKVFFDGIIHNLQHNGGITILFENLYSRMSKDSYLLNVPTSKSIFAPFFKVDVDQRFNIFHSTYYRLPVHKNIFTVTTVHDFTYELRFPFYKSIIHSHLKKKAVLHSDKIICVSENTKIDLLKFYGDECLDLITVIPNGVSDEFFVSEPNKKNDYALFVGSRVSYKNFLNSVRAVAKFDDLRLFIVGGGPLLKTEKSLLDSKLGTRYQKFDNVPLSLLTVLYSNALLLLYPSSYEGFGIPVLEAAASCTPCVCVSGSSIDEIANDSSIVINTPSVFDISEGIFAALSISNKNLLSGLAFAKNYTWDNTFNLTNSLYMSLLK